MRAIDWSEIHIGIKGGGEMATGVAVRLWRSGLKRIYMMEIEYPLAVRRAVSFCEAIHDRTWCVEGIKAVRAENKEDIFSAWKNDSIAIMIDPLWTLPSNVRTEVLIDAILAKKNLGTFRKDAPLVIGLGPGFTAPSDVDRAIETMRGHHLGRVISSGSTQPNTGIPGSIGGYTLERVLRTPTEGIFIPHRKITDTVKSGEIVATVAGQPIVAKIDGVVRGLIRRNTIVSRGMKVGDIDPRNRAEYCSTVSEKARAIGGAVLEAVLGAADSLTK